MLFRRGHKVNHNPEQDVPGATEIPGSGIFSYKKLGYGSAVVLTFLVVPLAVQGLSGTMFSDDEDSQPADAQQKSDGHVESSNTENGHSTDSNVDISHESGGQGTNSSSTEVTVNGESIPVPQNGSFQKKVTTKDNQTVVDVSIQNNQSGSYHNSSTTIEVNSDGSSAGDQTDARGGDRYSNHR